MLFKTSVDSERVASHSQLAKRALWSGVRMARDPGFDRLVVPGYCPLSDCAEHEGIDASAILAAVCLFELSCEHE